MARQLKTNRSNLDFGARMSGNYQDLKVWQKSLDLTLAVYDCTGTFPKFELHGLADQMRRAAVSVASNLAEGKGRSTDRDFTYFLCSRPRFSARTRNPDADSQEPWICR